MSAPPRVEAPAYYGACMLKRDEWVIAADPVAMIMLKRIFARVDKGDLGQVKIKRNDETDKLLQWFLDLYPLEMTDRDAAELHRGAETHRARAKLVKRILDHDYTPAEYSLSMPPRDYQRVAADMWLKMGGLLLADETGTGKTISAITGLSDPSTRPALVVVPGHHLAKQWREQLLRCLPGIRVHLAVGQRPTDPALLPGGWPDVVVCPYHLLQYWAEYLRPKIRAIVYDEVAELRHTDSEKYKAARGLSAVAPRVIGMSATPSYNYGGEYYAILDAVRPGCVGTWEEFDREWCVGEDERRKKRIRNSQAFGLWLDQSGIRLARTRKDVGRELPRRTVVPTYVDTDMSAYGKAMTGASECARAILAQTLGKGAGLSKMQAASEMDRIMRQATGIAKAPAIAGFIRMLVESGERPVVFGHHLDVYAVLEEQLDDLKPGFVTGRESTSKKAEAIRRFTARETDVLILGLRAQATGLDGLQFHSDVVVIGELDWSPKIHEQAISRVDRDREPIAPNRPVVVYYLLSEMGSDPVVADVCGAKDANTTPISYPDMDKIEAPEVDVNRARRLAEAHLQRHR